MNLKSEDGRKGKTLEQSLEDQHYRDEEEREAFERCEQSGMNVMNYIRNHAIFTGV